MEVPLEVSTEALASIVARVDDGSLLNDYVDYSQFDRSDAPIPASLKGAALHLIMFEDDRGKASSSSHLANKMEKMTASLHVFAMDVAEGEAKELRDTFKGFHLLRKEDSGLEAALCPLDDCRSLETLPTLHVQVPEIHGRGKYQ